MPYYHYTTLSAFKSILNSYLRMSKANQVRADGNEENVIQHMFSTLMQDDTTLLGKLADSLKVAPKVEAITEELNRFRNNSYILCLSKKPSNDYLWKEYAENGNGVVIQLCDNCLPIEISAISGELSTDTRTDDITLFDMVYGIDELKVYINSILNQNGPVKPSLYMLMDILKDKKHKLEEETRLLYCPGDIENLQLEKRYPTRSEIEIIPSQKNNHINLTYMKNESSTQELGTIRSFAAIVCKSEDTKNEIIKLINGKVHSEKKEGDQYILELI